MVPMSLVVITDVNDYLERLISKLPKLCAECNMKLHPLNNLYKLLTMWNCMQLTFCSSSKTRTQSRLLSGKSSLSFSSVSVSHRTCFSTISLYSWHRMTTDDRDVVISMASSSCWNRAISDVTSWFSLSYSALSAGKSLLTVPRSHSASLWWLSISDVMA